MSEKWKNLLSFYGSEQAFRRNWKLVSGWSSVSSCWVVLETFSRAAFAADLDQVCAEDMCKNLFSDEQSKDE